MKYSWPYPPVVVVELIYRDGFHLGFNDLHLYDYEIRDDEEQAVFDDGFISVVFIWCGD